MEDSGNYSLLCVFSKDSCMQTLRIVPRLFPELLKGSKRSTIRMGELHIEPGYLRYECEDDPSKTTVVWVTRCTYMPLNEAAAFCGMQDEWPPRVMLEGMREHYPLIQLSDTVQVVEHETPEQTKIRIASGS
ncbi:ASCH domain-containing protein [Pseudomonas sp. ATCC PTA-122608]|uniref:ASCH domain-containing protein n=2 Tax=Pseudomonas TaxID=286 RepID=UPI001C444D14|nr:ASCH domain-containing protein [Pseudomonas sp. ATCC PTA-122608]